MISTLLSHGSCCNANAQEMAALEVSEGFTEVFERGFGPGLVKHESFGFVIGEPVLVLPFCGSANLRVRKASFGLWPVVIEGFLLGKQKMFPEQRSKSGPLAESHSLHFLTHMRMIQRITSMNSIQMLI